MTVNAEGKVDVARTDDTMTVTTMATIPTVAAEAPIGHTTITGMTHARGTMGNVVKAMAHPLQIRTTATVSSHR